MSKASTHVLSTSRKHSTGSLWGVLREYGVDDRLLLAVKSLYSYSEICVCVGRVKPQPFTVGVGLRQGYRLSPLFFIVYMNWIDSRSRVNKGITVRSCWTNRLLYADDLLLLESSEKAVQHGSNRFLAACDQARIKIRTKKTKVYVFCRNPRQCMLQVYTASRGEVSVVGGIHE